MDTKQKFTKTKAMLVLNMAKMQKARQSTVGKAPRKQLATKTGRKSNPNSNCEKIKVQNVGPVPGCYTSRKTNAGEVEFCDFKNLASFMLLLQLPGKDLFKWLQQRGILVSQMFCDRCKQNCKLLKSKKSQFELAWGCNKNKNHLTSVAKTSFLDNCVLNFRDVFVFIRSYLLGIPVELCAKESGIEMSSANKYAQFIRGIFYREVQTFKNHVKFKGHVEINEMKMGNEEQKWKRQGKGLGIILFSLLEKESNRILLFSVKDLTSETLMPLIEKYVEKETVIYSSDEWANCLELKLIGYKHLDKNNFKAETNKLKKETNKPISDFPVEDAWVYTKTYFKSRFSCPRHTFDGHLAEIMWRNWHQCDDIFDCFFSQIKAPCHRVSQKILPININLSDGEERHSEARGRIPVGNDKQKGHDHEAFKCEADIRQNIPNIENHEHSTQMEKPRMPSPKVKRVRDFDDVVREAQEILKKRKQRQ